MKAKRSIYVKLRGWIVTIVSRAVETADVSKKPLPFNSENMSNLFAVQQVGHVNVIELILPDELDSVEFDKLNDSMLHLFDGRSSERWILDLSKTQYVGSAVLGLMVNVRQHVKTAQGKLVICSLSRTLNDIFHASSLERLFTIAKNRNEALKLL